MDNELATMEAVAYTNSHKPDCYVEGRIPNKESNTKVVLVCDTSGSMGGHPREQVLKTVDELDGYDFEIINYSSRSMLLSKRSDLIKTWQNGGTQFRRAFETMIKYAKENSDCNVVFVFLTDGKAQDDPEDKCASSWAMLHEESNCTLSVLRTELRRLHNDVVVHCFGLGLEHDQAFLDKLRKAGNKEGVYVYASRKSSEISEELLSTVMFATRNVKLPLNIDGKHTMVDGYIEGSSITFQLSWPNIPDKITQGSSSCTPKVEKNDLMHGLADISNRVYAIKENDSLQLIELQKRLNELKGTKMKLWERVGIMEKIDSLQKDMDHMLSVFSQNTKGSMNSDEFSARLRSLAFLGRMSKARMNRTMDQRAELNRHFLQNVEKNLSCIPTPSSMELDAISEEYKCDISHITLVEMLSDTDYNTDIMGNGLVFFRDEVAVDQPSTVHVKQGPTLLCFNTFADAALYQLNQGNVNSTGTFDKTQITSVCSGVSGEPINGFLPIYGSETHYKRVRVLLPIVLGLTFTLSETGYHPKQVPALFAILARLYRQANSERNKFIVAHFKQLCEHILIDGELMKSLHVPKLYQPMHIVDRFCTDVESHQKSELPTMDILYGCMLASNGNSLAVNFDEILLLEVFRRYFNHKMSVEKGGRDHFYNTIQTFLFGEDYSKSEPILKNTPELTKKDGSFHFVKPEFEDYVPLPLVDRVVKPEWLDKIGVSMDPEVFMKDNDVIGLTITKERYIQLLYFCVVYGMYNCANDKYRETVDQKLFVMDPSDTESVNKFLNHVYEQYDAKRRENWSKSCEKRELEVTAEYIVFNLDRVDHFLHFVKDLTRGSKIWSVLVTLMFPDNKDYDRIPLYDKKLAIMITSKYNGNVVFEGGPWMAGKHYAELIREKWKGTNFEQILQELDSSSIVHLYRMSDKPNRHGHCNSNPLWKAKPDDPNVKFLISMWDR